MTHWKQNIFLPALLAVAQVARAADTTPPAVTIFQPAVGSTVSGMVKVAATATDNVGVASVSLKLDGAGFTSPLTAAPFNAFLDTTSVPNGTHTLLVAASDAAGNTARSPLVQFTIANQALYKLGSGPFTVEDLGPLLSANTQEKQIMFRLPSNNDLHLLLYYDVTAIGTYPLQILDVNLTRETARLTDGILGRPGPNATVLHPNGKIYLGSSDPGYLLEYDPATGATNFIGKLHPTLRRDAQIAEIGDDDSIYIGEYSPLGGGVARYNPKNAVFEDLGLMDTNFNAPQYSYTIGANGRYIYVGLGERPWYLGIYDTKTKARTLFWKNEGDTGGTVYHGKNGLWYYGRGTTNGSRYYVLTNNAPTQIASLPAVYQWYERGNVINDVGHFAAGFGVAVNLDEAYPDSSRNHTIIRWRTVGANNWHSVDIGGFRLEPINIKRLYPWDSHQLFGFADFYGPVFRFDLQTANITILGRPQYSLYDTLFEPGRVYFSGYTAATLMYDPLQQWTLSGSTTNQYDPGVNPRKLHLGFGKYHYYSAFGADGMVYVGGYHIRDSTGGELGWYDPITGTSGSLREPFLNYALCDLKSALGGTKLVYSSNNEKLFVFDVASKQIERVITPIPGAGALDKIVEVAPGIIFGATGSNVFKVDIRDGSILYTNTLPGQAFGGSTIMSYDRRLVLGPDGYVWLFIDNSLYRLNPANDSRTKILDAPAKSLLFKDGDLYLYGGPNLYRIQKVMNVILEPPAALRLSLPK